AMGTLFHGDNLSVLRRHVPDASVDLVYLDPPFQSGRDYSLLFETRGASLSERRRARGSDRARRDRATPADEAQAFRDTWRWGPEAETAFGEVQAIGGGAARTTRALRETLGESDVLAYLCMMAPRLVELRRVLRGTGSLYLHCDPTASHYLKVLLDGIFGAACFRNEIIWRYRRWPARARRFQRMHDVLLYYSARPGNQHTWNTLYGYERLAPSTLKTFGTRKQQADFSSGRRKPGVLAIETAGPPLSDFWELDDSWEVGVIAAIGRERTGYPTQKPEALLERVVRASSGPGDVVLDPFCGSGTAVAVADRLERRWIGIDLAPRAIEVARARLGAARVDVVTVGSPGGEPSPSGVGEDRSAALPGPAKARARAGAPRDTPAAGSVAP
ncbi:MAG: site-specific DNA-methyltransferase, partial [Myxococcales bacterium]|nr:site-specific DNA-methyltransferase [Myxococcales bacterium]